MRHLESSIKHVAATGLCMSCGACKGVSPDGAVRLVYDPQGALLLPEPGPTASNADLALAFQVCPGKGYPIETLAQRFLSHNTAYDIELGHWNAMWAARSTDPAVVQSASSGGVMSEIALLLLSMGRVDGVAVTGMTYGPPGPRPHTYIARTRDEVLAAQGSKYCPSPGLEVLSEVQKFPGKLAYVGTPCQIGALRLLQHTNDIWAQRFLILVGNFCGGFRDYRQTDTLLHRYGLDPANVREFRYRGGGQPGSLRAVDTEGRSVQRAYPGYAKDTTHAKVRRCRLCVDATAELADISCGDAWIPRYLTSGNAWSLVMTRSDAGVEVIRELERRGRIVAAQVSPEEVKASQASNLTSKKKRQAARRRLYGMLHRTIPDYEGGYPDHQTSLWREAIVDINHHLGSRAEEGRKSCQVAMKLISIVKHRLRSARQVTKA